MDSIVGVAGLLVGIASIIFTWHVSTKNKRLVKKAEKHRAEIDKIKSYSKGIGYKSILHDGFHIFSYAGAVCLFTLALQTIIPNLQMPELFMPELVIIFTNQLASGLYGGAGAVLWMNYRRLNAAYEADEAVLKLEKKVENLQEDL